MNRSTAKQNNVVISEEMREMSDNLLVSAARSGDSSAFVELSKRHSKKIQSKIYQITKNWHDAEDVLQDSLLKAFVHLNSFEGRSSFSSWLTRIAINSALMLLRKNRGLEVPIDCAHDDSEGWRTWEPRDSSETPEGHYVRREREEMLKSAILRLPIRMRAVVELRHVQEYSASEIAQVLGISVAAAKSRLSRARLTIQASLSEQAMAP